MAIASKSCRALFQKLERNLSKLDSHPLAKNVHSFRTSTRRLQILLGDLAPHTDRNAKKLLKLLGHVRKRAGKVRDLDMQLAALRTFKMAREPRRKTQLMNHLIELRGRQERKLRKALDKETIRDIRKRLKRSADKFDIKSARDPLAVATAMLRKIDSSSAPINEALLHQYRILTKRARYAAEFASPSAEADRFSADLKRVQDALGDWHDWLTLTQTAKNVLGEVRESPLVAELHNVTGAKFRRAVSALTHIRPKIALEQKPPSKPASQSPTKTPAQAETAA
jgi:CHAD domain-containing protein